MCLEFGHVSAHFEPFGKLLLFVSVSDRTYKLHFECMRFMLCHCTYISGRFLLIVSVSDDCIFNNYTGYNHCI